MTSYIQRVRYGRKGPAGAISLSLGHKFLPVPRPTVSARNLKERLTATFDANSSKRMSDNLDLLCDEKFEEFEELEQFERFEKFERAEDAGETAVRIIMGHFAAWQTLSPAGRPKITYICIVRPANACQARRPAGCFSLARGP